MIHRLALGACAWFCISVSAGSEHVSGKIDAPLVKIIAEHPDAVQSILVRMVNPDGAANLTMQAPGEGRPAFVVNLLTARAEVAQASFLRWLSARDIDARSYWLGNMVSLSAKPSEIKAIAMRGDVGSILLNRSWHTVLPKAEPAPFPRGQDIDTPMAGEPSLHHIGVPAVWATGITGEGVVIAGQDTGYQWDHPALRNSYRGWNNGVADHNYNWHDAVHELVGPGANSCGLDSQVPCDDHDHGTHTMGTMVGDDGGANQIGVAPGARWIGCRSLEDDAGTTSTYTECFQWFIAPTALDGGNPNPELAPHIVNNSWYCNLDEGCTPAETELMEEVVETVRAAGILVVAIAGNFGSSCTTINYPPGTFPASFTVGATLATSDVIAGFSSRGATPDGLLKPDVTAPGASIRSSIRGGAYVSFSGTSMAAPHVAGTAALLMSVNPSLRRNPGAVEAILRDTAVPLTSAQDCGGYPGAVVPNAVFGHGRIDAWAAFRVAETIFADPFD